MAAQDKVVPKPCGGQAQCFLVTYKTESVEYLWGKQCIEESFFLVTLNALRDLVWES
jgi:hypothetical protein